MEKLCITTITGITVYTKVSKNIFNFITNYFLDFLPFPQPSTSSTITSSSSSGYTRNKISLERLTFSKYVYKWFCRSILCSFSGLRVLILFLYGYNTFSTAPCLQFYKYQTQVLLSGSLHHSRIYIRWIYFMGTDKCFLNAVTRCSLTLPKILKHIYSITVLTKVTWRLPAPMPSLPH